MSELRTGPRIAGLVLAAGEGRRFGQPKALVEMGGERLVDRAVRTLREAGCAPVVVVTGAVAVEPAGALAVANPDWRSGMASSLTTGLRALAGLPDPPAAAVVALVDQPGIGPEVVRRLLLAYLQGARVAVASYTGRPRNPVLLARDTWEDVATAVSGDRGARDYLAAHPELVHQVECGDVGDPTDVDAPEDLAAVEAHLLRHVRQP